MCKKKESYEQQMTALEQYNAVGSLRKGEVIEIDGLHFKQAVCDNPLGSPCMECQVKWRASRKICQLCIGLDYSYKNRKERYKLVECTEEGVEV